MSENNSTTETVEYREIPGTNGAYRVGNDGSVWTIWNPAARRFDGNWRRLKGSRTSCGYVFHHFTDGIVKWSEYAHRLVLKTFVGDPPPEMECRHLNGIPSDNRLCNLTWGTRGENNLDKRRHGYQYPQGEDSSRAVLTRRIVEKARLRAASGESITSLAEEYGVNLSTLRSAIHGSTWSWLPGALTISLRRGRCPRDKILIPKGFRDVG